MVEQLPDNAVPISREQYRTFGAIIHSFARLEWAIQLTMAAVADMDYGKITILTRDLGYAAKRDALYSYMEIMDTAEDLKEEIKRLIGAADKYNGLRNHIAHSLWHGGDRPNSIQPLTIRVRGGRGKLVGAEGEPDYTDAELATIADRLHQIHNDHMAFMRARFPALMAD